MPANPNGIKHYCILQPLYEFNNSQGHATHAYARTSVRTHRQTHTHTFYLGTKYYFKIKCIYVNVNTTLHNEQPIKTYECKACSWDL
jgi:hypothetical protein